MDYTVSDNSFKHTEDIRKNDMLKAKTTTARFKAPADKVQNFIANVENLPKWATGFCKNLKKQGDDYIVTTPGGDLFFRIDQNQDNGITDMWGGPSKDMMMRWPVRVLPDGFGGSVLAFTAIQTPDQPDEVFEGQCKELEVEFENIRAHVDGEILRY